MSGIGGKAGMAISRDDRYYSALRVENLFCSYTPSANAITCDYVRLGTLKEHQGSGVAGALLCTTLRLCRFTRPADVRADKCGRNWFVR
jgi:hypothetical protein